ncbi:heavy metal sensor histidine kinase [Xylophilus sp. GOD-11R]|uniref:heavy metal sensor histidine kinase n=1 Tax=Xylophilus sp. GOD-11R TaxID=3089814 RepID=UPI00298C9791|nr:heavy metal sensor histidine kinase [Xylophilus sp. GOD-11R]WPB55375.1 heavy metal sensor histidine kinase [Xylophilus sp. GOD-11R]
MTAGALWRTWRDRPYALGARLSRLLALQALLGLGAVCVVVYWLTAWALASRADEEIARKTALVQLLLERSVHDGDHDFLSLGQQFDRLFREYTDISLSLRSRDGSLDYRSPTAPGFGASRVREAAFELEASWVPGGRADVLLRMDQSPDALLLGRLAWILAAVALGGAATVGLGGYWLVQRGLAPMRDLAVQTRALTADRLDQRLSTPHPSLEMQPWIEQVNALLARLQRALQQAESFNADVAHELRTPLTILIGETELMLTGDRGPDELRDTLASNLEELRRLGAIVGDMLFLSRVDRGAVARRGPPCSLAAEVAKVAEFHEAALEERGLTVSVVGDSHCRYDGGLMRRALSNLLGNASRYAETGSNIAVNIATAPDGGDTELTVANRGAPIPQAQLERVFDRFYRLEADRAGGDAGHHGLGLAIVAAILRMHGGSARAVSSVGVTSVLLRFGDDDAGHAADLASPAV